MKKINYAILCGLIAMNCNLSAQGSSSPQGASSNKIKGTTPTTIVRPPLGGVKPKSQEKEIEKQEELGQVHKYTLRPTFTQPGILSAGGAGGVDHLYNIGTDIPVNVELVKSDGILMSVTSERIQAMVEKFFISEGISPNVKPSDGPALPFFHVLIMVIPAGDGFSAFCAGRLFEKVTLDRVNLPAGVFFQAITWEYQNIIYASKEDGEKQIDAALADIVGQFISRYKYYKNITVPQ